MNTEKLITLVDHLDATHPKTPHGFESSMTLEAVGVVERALAGRDDYQVRTWPAMWPGRYELTVSPFGRGGTKLTMSHLTNIGFALFDE